MDPSRLADDLKTVWYYYSGIPRDVLDIVSDTEVIDSFSACMQCRVPLLTPEKRDSLVAAVDDWAQFLTILEMYGREHCREGYQDSNQADWSQVDESQITGLISQINEIG